jgi:hypothetical protein
MRQWKTNYIWYSVCHIEIEERALWTTDGFDTFKGLWKWTKQRIRERICGPLGPQRMKYLLPDPSWKRSVDSRYQLSDTLNYIIYNPLTENNFSYINCHKVLVANGAHILQHMALVKNRIVKFQPSKQTPVIRTANCTIIPVTKKREKSQHYTL